MKYARHAPLVLLGAAAALPIAVVACGSKPAANASFSLNSDAGDTSQQNCQPGQPCPPPQNCQPGQPCPPPPNCGQPGQQPCPPPAASSAGPLGSVYTTDPNQLAAILAAAAAAGSAFLTPMGQAVGDPAEAGLRLAAAKYAPGMTPEGQVAKGNLAEGGHVAFMVTMEPTKCYTVVGFGAGVQDLDLNLLAPPFYNLLAGQDGMAGPTAVIGASPRPMCPLTPIAIPYKVDIFAKKGGGAVAAQVYSKPK